jgi:hypothetical protein
VAVSSVSEIFKGRGFSGDARGTSTYARVWRVITDGRKTGSQAVRDAVPVYVGDAYEIGSGSDAWYEVDVFAIAARKRGEPEGEDGKTWLVTVDYESLNAESIAGIGDPTLQPPKFAWSSNRFQGPTDFDVSGNVIRNSAGDPFNPPAFRDASRPMLRVTRAELSFDDAVAVLYRDSINADLFFGHASGTAKCHEIAGEDSWHNTIGRYWLVTRDFEFDFDGWNKPFIDMGLRSKAPGSFGDREQILADGVPITSPVLLNGDGRPLKAYEVNDGVFYTLDYPLYVERDFDDFGL